MFFGGKYCADGGVGWWDYLLGAFFELQHASSSNGSFPISPDHAAVLLRDPPIHLPGSSTRFNHSCIHSNVTYLHFDRNQNIPREEVKFHIGYVLCGDWDVYS